MANKFEESSSSDNDSYRAMSESSSSDSDDNYDTKSPWLDRKALQPFLNEKTGLTGLSTLCGACREFLRGKKEAGIRYRHIRMLSTLQDTTSRGCHMCSMIHQWVDRHTLNHHPFLTPNIYLEVSRRYPDDVDHLDLWCYCKKGSRRPRYGNFVRGIKVIELVSSRARPENAENPHTMAPSTWSAENRQLVSSWINRCLTEHTQCNRSTSRQGWLLTRLLNIKTSDNSEGNIHLTRTTDIEPTTRYASLSHCWGIAPVLSLLTENISLFQQGISIETLPKTFRHAIEVASFLGLDYIWIDSLCIKQDSVDDWRSECSLMRYVYQNAFCNIAATGSPDSHRGLFFERDPSLVTAGQVDAQWHGDFPTGEYCFFHQNLWITGVAQAPLNKRAWVVQERFLARRVLHFGSQELFFECCEQEACETFPGGLPKRVYDNDSLSKFKQIFNSECASADPRQKYGTWRRIVDAFIRSDLTKENDKVIALSGVAEEFQQSIMKQPYVAGFWGSAFARQLLWLVVGERQANGQLSRRPSEYRAPSWSWLSIDGPVHLEFPTQSEPSLVDIEQVHIDLLDKNFETGPITAGYIILRCYVLQATCGARGSSDPNIPKDYLLIGGQEIGTTTLFFDEATPKPSSDERVFCVPIWHSRVQSRSSGLVLTPTKTGLSEYRRIGVFKAAEKDFSNLIVKMEEGSRVALTVI